MASAASGAAADALAAALLELERARMRAADLESLVAQRMFTSSQQVPEIGRPMTWEALYLVRHDNLIEAHHALRGVRDLLPENDVGGALGVAVDVVGESSASEAEGGEEESLDDDSDVDMQTRLLDAVAFPAPAPAAPAAPAPAAEVRPFSGRCFRLDNA